MGTLQGTTAIGGQRGLSRILAWACLALAAVLPLAVLASVVQISPADMLTRMGIRMPDAVGADDLSIAIWQQGLVVCISLLPVSAMAYALWRAHQCFIGFVRGEVFSLATVRHLRGFAAGLLLASGAGVVAPTLIALLLTLNAPAGGRVLTINLGSQQLLMLLFSGIVWQIGHAMTRAVEIAEDNAQII